jgi:hypothetical protein
MAAADRYGFALEFRIVALFDRRVKGIHVDMDDLADRAVSVGHGAVFLSYSARSSLAAAE